MRGIGGGLAANRKTKEAALDLRFLSPWDSFLPHQGLDWDFSLTHSSREGSSSLEAKPHL